MGHSHGRRWGVESIERQIRTMIEDLDMTTFPTHSEMDAYYGNDGLSNRVSKTGGTKYWAAEFGLPVKTCESSFGDKYEIIAMNDVEKHTGLSCVQMIPRYPYDILVDKHIKVDVKVSRQKASRTRSIVNNFELAKRDPTCDVYMLYCLDLHGDLTKTIIIPSCITSGQRSIGVGEESKWNAYKDNWELFLQYAGFYKSLTGGFQCKGRRHSTMS